MTMPGLWAVVPVKSLGAAKQRLAPVLAPLQRRRLVLAMLADVLDALSETVALRGTLVISADAEVLVVAAGAGAACLRQGGDIGFAASADAAAAWAMQAYGASGIMVVPADVPLATPDDFAMVIAAHHAPGCTIVPSWDGAGSNCVLLSPPLAMRFQFGPYSAERHLAAAQNAGIAARIVQCGRLSRDVDTAADLARLAGEPGGRRLSHVIGNPPSFAPSAVCLEDRL